MSDQIIKTLRDIPVDAMRRASLAYAIQVLRASGEAGTESACLLLEQHIDELRDASPNAFPDPYADAGPDVVDWKRGAFHVGKPPSEAALKIINNGHLLDTGRTSYPAPRGELFTRTGSAPLDRDEKRVSVEGHTVQFVARPLADVLPHVTPDGAALKDLEGRAPTDVVITDELLAEFQAATVSQGYTSIANACRLVRDCRASELVTLSVHNAIRHWLKYDKSFRRG